MSIDKNAALSRKRARLAACLAISNLGHEVPADVAEGSENWSTNPVYEVESLAGHLMESGQHERIFAGEARMWHKTVKQTPKADLIRIHGVGSPWVEAIVNAE